LYISPVYLDAVLKAHYPQILTELLDRPSSDVVQTALETLVLLVHAGGAPILKAVNAVLPREKLSLLAEEESERVTLLAKSLIAALWDTPDTSHETGQHDDSIADAASSEPQLAALSLHVRQALYASLVIFSTILCYFFSP
jgi:hypothetical protein